MKIGLRVLFALVLLIVVLVRVRMLALPLDPDEGCYAYAGRLWLEGHPPMTDSPEAPVLGHFWRLGVYACYTLIMGCFGQTPAGIHLGLLGVVLAGTALTVRLGWTLGGETSGLGAGMSYAVMSLSPAVIGFSANTEPFVLLFALAGTLCLWLGLERGRTGLVLVSGICFALGCVVKQTGLYFTVFGAAAIIAAGGPRRLLRLAVFSAGVTVPLAVVLAATAMAGTLREFWFWAVLYPSEDIAVREFPRTAYWLSTTLPTVLRSFALPWLAAAGGTVVLLRNARASFSALFFLLFLLFSLLAVTPGFYFWQHYYLLMLPAAALMIGAAAGRTETLLAARRPAAGTLAVAVLLAGSLGYTLYHDRACLFRLDHRQVLRVTWGAVPLPESPVIGDYIRSHTGPEDRIAILGSQPQILFEADRRSATRYLFVEHVFRDNRFAPAMREAMIRELTAARPAVIVFEPRYFELPGSAPALEWFKAYRKRGYVLSGVVDIVSPEETRFIWGREALRYRPRSPYWLTVWQRKSGGRGPRADASAGYDAASISAKMDGREED